jgi:hypothetical protein
VAGYAELLIYLAAVGIVWVTYALRKYRRRVSKPRLGDAQAYDGNLVTIPPGRRAGGVTCRSSHASGHLAPSHGGAFHAAGHHQGALHH